MNGKILFKEIPLLPTTFHVDVWICDDMKLLSEKFHKRYGASIEYYKEELIGNCVQSITSTVDAELKAITRIVMIVDDFTASIITHEINHVLHHLSDHCHIEITAQEWCSYMLEYLFEQCIDEKSFISIV